MRSFLDGCRKQCSDLTRIALQWFDQKTPEYRQKCGELGQQALEWSYRQVPEAPKSSCADTSLDALPSLVIDANWNLPPTRFPHWLVHDAGPDLEAIAQRLVDSLRTEMGPATVPTVASELRNDRGSHRGLRFLHTIARGHVAATDVVLRAEGRDLYCRVSAKPRTLLSYLRYCWMAGMFLAAFLSCFGLYLLITGAKTSWAGEYATKHAVDKFPNRDKSSFVKRSILEGCYRTHWPEIRRRLRADPKLVVSLQSRASARADSITNTDGKNIGVLAQAVSEGVFLRMLASAEEYLPDLIALRIMNHSNDDLSAYWTDDDDFIPANVGDKSGSILLLGLANTDPILWSESLAELKLVDSVIEFSGNDRALRRILNASTTWIPRWSYLRLFLADPGLALSNLLAPGGLIAGIVGFFTWRSPRSWLRYPCDLLGWVRPDDYDNEVVARNGRVVRLLSSALQEYGYDRNRITELGGGVDG